MSILVALTLTIFLSFFYISFTELYYLYSAKFKNKDNMTRKELIELAESRYSTIYEISSDFRPVVFSDTYFTKSGKRMRIKFWHLDYNPEINLNDLIGETMIGRYDIWKVLRIGKNSGGDRYTPDNWKNDLCIYLERVATK